VCSTNRHYVITFLDLFNKFLLVLGLLLLRTDHKEIENQDDRAKEHKREPGILLGLK
jgi:hypothetical protein